MIYTLGFKDLFTSNDVDIDFIFNYFKDHDEVEFDTETRGLDCHTKPLICFQLGDYENQFVINKNYLPKFKNFLEKKTLIGQNIKFDLKFLYKNNIFPNKVYDTYLAESVLYSGYDFRKKSLDAILNNRFGIVLDKSYRDRIWEKEVDTSLIDYAASDVKYLGMIKKDQLKEAEDKDLLNTIYLENKFVLVLAYIEFCGFKLDRLKWKDKCDEDYKKMLEARSKLDKYILDNKITKFINAQIDIFSSECGQVTVNWNSPKQVAEFFKYINAPVGIDKSGNISVAEKNIAKYSQDFPLISDYLEYKGLEKLVGTYGENFFKHINPVTGRIHTQFKQVLNTGRISSGGKNKESKEDYINFQNLPSDKLTRSCFIAEEGNTLLISDYSGQEQVVLANKSLDPSLLEFYDKGLADMHSFVASKMYRELEGLNFEEIKEQHKDKRQSAKTAGFAINYGGNGSTIARNNNLSEEEGEFIYNSYFEAFPGLKDYFKKVQKQVLLEGYVLINDFIKRKCYVPGYDQFVREKSDFTSDFWTRYKKERELGSEEFKIMKEKVSNWFKFKGKMERMALNYPIQGTSADITKISCIYFFEWLKNNNLLNIVLFVNTIHDENVVECPLDMVETVRIALRDAMNKAADLFCKRVKLTAEPEVSKFWKK